VSEPTGFIAEGYARRRVPDVQLGGAHRVFFIVAGSLCGLPGYVLAAQIVNGMGPRRAVYAFVVGGLLSGLLGALSAYSGARTRMNLAMLADEAFGQVGGRIVKTVIALSLIGWVGVILSVLGSTAGAAIHSIYGVTFDSAWIGVIGAVAVTVVALRGVTGLEHVGMLIAPLLLALIAWTLYKGCGSSPVATGVPGTLGFGAAVSAVVGEYVVGIVIQPDYGRFVRRPAGAGIAAGLALGVAFPCILTLAAIPTFNCRAHDLIEVMVLVGIGLPALLLLVLGAGIDASACLYSGSLSLTNQVKRFKLPWATACSAAVGAAIAILHAEQVFMPFLGILGVAFPPVAAVTILHTLRLGVSENGAPPTVRPVALLAWLLGSVTGYLTSHEYFAITGIASIDSVIVTAALWLAGTAVTRRTPAVA